MADLIRKIQIGRTFSATAGGAQNSIITAITAGGKPALLGVPLHVTPNMRFVVQGRNLSGYNRALIVTSTNQAYPVLPKFSRDREFEYWMFDVPNYGDSAFTFSLRLTSTQPGILSAEVDKFDYAQETEEEKKDREKKAAEAAAAQAKAEEEQKNIKRDKFEQNQAAGLTAVGNVGAVAGAVFGGAAEGLAAAASAVEKTAAPVVHKWRGADDHGGGTNEVSGSTTPGTSAASLKATDFANSTNPTGQAQTSAPKTALRATQLAPGTPSQPSPSTNPAAAPNITGQASVIRRAPEPVRSQAAPVNTSGPIAAPPPTRTPSASFRIINQEEEEEPANAVRSSSTATSVRGQVQAQAAPSRAGVSSQTSVFGSRQVDINGTVSTGGTGDQTARFTRETKTTGVATGSARVAGTVNVEQAAAASAGGRVTEQQEVSEELTSRQRAQLRESSSLEQKNIGVAIAEPPAASAAPGSVRAVVQPAPAGSKKNAGPTQPAKPPVPLQPFKNRQTLKLEAEYDAKFKVFQNRSRDLDVKLKRPEGIVPSAPISADKIRQGGETAVGETVNRQTSEPAEDEETQEVTDREDKNEVDVQDIADVAEEFEPLNNRGARQEAINLPQKLPADLSSRTAAVENLPAGEAGAAPVEGAAAAEAGGAAAGAAEGAAGGMAAGAEAGAVAGPPGMLAGAAVGMVAAGGGKDKAITAAADVIAGPEAGIAISFFKKHWKLIVGLLVVLSTIFVGLVLVFLLTLTSALCNNWFTGALAYMAGYNNVCTALKNAGAGTIVSAGVTTANSLNTNPGNGQCTPVVSGPASVASLQSTCFGGNAQQASIIAGAESGGNQFSLSGSDVCHGDGKVFSVGLFQINLLVHTITDPNTGQTLNCPGAFIINQPYVKTNASGNTYYDCSVNPAQINLYNQCVSAAENAQSNIQAACVISSNGTNWNAWSTHTKCGL
jgi:hypothetical protein